MRKGKKDYGRFSHIVLFFILFCAVFLLIIPLYKISYSAAKDRIYSQISSEAQRVTEAIDSEMVMYHTIKMEMMSDARYIKMKNLKQFESSAQYIYLKDFADFFIGRAAMMNLNDNTFIFFRNNDTVISKDRIFDSFSAHADSYLKIDGMGYEDFRNSIFRAGTGVSVRYVNDVRLDGELSPSIVVFHPVNFNVGQPPEAVMIGIYSTDALFEQIGGGYREVFDYVAINDAVVYSGGSKPDLSEAVVTMCSNAELRLTLVISESYLGSYMRGFTRFAVIYVAALFLIVLCLEFFVSWYTGRSMRNMVRLVASVSDEEIHSEEDVMASLGRLNENQKNYEKTLLMMLFLKPLDEDECKLVRSKQPDFPEPFLFAVFYGDKLSVGILELLMDRFGIDRRFAISPEKGEVVVFFEYSDTVDIPRLRRSLDELCFEARKKGVNLTVLISIPCSRLGDFYQMYTHIQSYYRFIDYEGVFEMKAPSEDSTSDETADLTGIRLREAVMCGEAFEAKKLVYEQWYSLMIGNSISDADIEKMFYSQIGILAEVAIKVHYNGELVRYSRKKKINELAFSVADNIDSICELIDSSRQHNSEYDKVLLYIKDNFAKIDFGIPDVEAQFGVTGKTINKIVKNSTGRTFTEYVEEHRLMLAKQLLEESGEEIRVISERCGFFNYDTFYRFFKKHTGTSPAKWRRTKMIENSFGTE
ncbi:MAG: AraC family transcriptional regulator [Clostridia bacterium]|nr:AraC family transcriptional regulator [Clostridia bacterium]